MTNSEVELVTSLPDMVVKLTVTAAERQKYEIEAEMARMAEEEDIMSPLKGNNFLTLDEIFFIRGDTSTAFVPHT